MRPWFTHTLAETEGNHLDDAYRSWEDSDTEPSGEDGQDGPDAPGPPEARKRSRPESSRTTKATDDNVAEVEARRVKRRGVHEGQQENGQEEAMGYDNQARHTSEGDASTHQPENKICPGGSGEHAVTVPGTTEGTWQDRANDNTAVQSDRQDTTIAFDDVAAEWELTDTRPQSEP